MLTPDPVTVLLVDDHAVVRAGCRVLIEASPDLKLIGEAASGEAAIRLTLEQSPDVVLLDLGLPGIGGMETIRRLLQRKPEARILVFSLHEDTHSAAQALQAGAKGYLGKGSPPSQLLEALRTVAAGGIALDAGTAEGIASLATQGESTGLASLSTREFQVFSLMAAGVTVGAAARQLSLSPKTIANYTTQIKSKLKVATLAELTRLAIQHGVVKV